MFGSMIAGTPLHRQLPKGVRLRPSSLTWPSPAFLVSQKYLVAFVLYACSKVDEISVIGFSHVYLYNLKLLYVDLLNFVTHQAKHYMSTTLSQPTSVEIGQV